MSDDDTTEERDEAEDWTEAGPLHSADEATYQQEMLGYRIDAFLRRRGWKQTSATPGCVWLWEREVDGRRVLVGQATAMSIEKRAAVEPPSSGEGRAG